MKPSEIIASARRQFGVDSGNYPDATAVIDLNLVYDDFNADIVSETNEDWFWNSIVTDSVVGQSEYRIEEAGTDDKISTVDEVFVKYGSSDQYQKARRIHPSELTKDRSYYESSQSVLDPIYFVQDQSVFVFPVADEAVTGGIKLHVTLVPTPISLSTDTEDSIKIPRRFHRVLVQGMGRYIREARQDSNGAVSEMQKYDKMKGETLAQIKNRDQGIIEIGTPDLSRFE